MLTVMNKPTFSHLQGLLKVGVPKNWDDSKKNLSYIRNAGVRQFISTYNRVKDLRGDELLWGDEIEYGVFHLDPKTKKVRLSLRAKEVSSLFIISPSVRSWQCDTDGRHFVRSWTS